jgi:hypothetical protein
MESRLEGAELFVVLVWPIFRAAAFQDILTWGRFSCDSPEFIEVFCGVPRLVGLPIPVR